MKAYLLTLTAAAALAAGCGQSIESASQDFNSLPPAVQKTIRADAPQAQITGISKTTQNGVDAYEVDLTQGNQTSKMIVAADGRLLSSDLPRQEPAGLLEQAARDVSKALTPTGAVGTPFSALPEAVQKTIQENAPPTEIADISKFDEEGRTIYEVEFKNPNNNPTLRVAQDGTLVQPLQSK